ncbi:hypothetical protein [Natronobacterium gregoryi]|uniref:DUF7967 domain-containing protein n=2 Tax=Natronobacterium gregoryi TaxID=44930 RepID=L0AIL9_NATGS|nr:hypothetical protein [Natronobacterium gregoryi]AFZ72915.1 hypothetical protein Natgr_1718 [Natronobacterium gregoryi SP2]ELY69789.1 hypothetical protein C490_07306 [Natronobacterium gregoryi SP2]PLK21857.1 hypothetical protein CYV19_01810 [Natronobacterium gregoryi SP2]SFI67152.1 hypothetical protein SAMN05443661_10383 [Natronobacterium gregoryi]
MSEESRCWLVERDYDDKGLVTLTYATADGEHVYRRELAASAATNSKVTAAKSIEKDQLESVADEETRDRYATEVERTSERYEPDEPI